MNKPFNSRSRLSSKKRQLLAQLTASIPSAGNTSRSIQRRQSDEPAPLSWAQERLWFLNRLEPDSAAYNEAFALRIVGPIEKEKVGQAINGILGRHEVLRSVFQDDGGDTTQRTLPVLEIP